MNNLTLYCNCFNGYENRMTQFDQHNLMCGAQGLRRDYRTDLAQRGFVFDDVGDNISNLNKYLGDLTGLYWVWKNTQDPVVGTNQYRRMWDEEQIRSQTHEPTTVYVLQRIDFDETVYDQYVRHHGQFGMDMLFEAQAQGRIDLPNVAQLKTLRYLHCNNMFYASRPVFDQVCNRLFPIVLDLFDKIKYIVHTAPANQTRTVAFLAERILTLMFVDPDYYFPGCAVREIGWSFDPRK